MKAIVNINNQEVVPVRLVQFVTARMFSPDALVKILAHEGPRDYIELTAYSLEPDGSYHAMGPRDWDYYHAELEALDKELKGKESYRNQCYGEWVSRSTKVLPKGVFVFLRDLNTAFDKWHERAAWEQDKPSGLNLFSPVPDGLEDVCLQGFENYVLSDGQDGLSAERNKEQLVAHSLEKKQLEHELDLQHNSYDKDPRKKYPAVYSNLHIYGSQC